jgi:8-oxo-dGTP pyrophosphatase MutT (NUDIX family)
MQGRSAVGSPRVSKSLPLQVAAVCFRRRATTVEFLLVNTNGGNKWTFPKGSIDARLSHSQAAEREAAEEAGALGTIEPRHFHLYLHSKGVFWQPGGVQEFVVKAFLMEIHDLRRADEPLRNPTWFSPDEAKRRLAKGREVKYGREMEAVIDRALERIQFHRAPGLGYANGRNGHAVVQP